MWQRSSFDVAGCDELEMLRGLSEAWIFRGVRARVPSQGTGAERPEFCFAAQSTAGKGLRTALKLCFSFSLLELSGKGHCRYGIFHTLFRILMMSTFVRLTDQLFSTGPRQLHRETSWASAPFPSASTRAVRRL